MICVLLWVCVCTHNLWEYIHRMCNRKNERGIQSIFVLLLLVRSFGRCYFEVLFFFLFFFLLIPFAECSSRLPIHIAYVSIYCVFLLIGMNVYGVISPTALAALPLSSSCRYCCLFDVISPTWHFSLSNQICVCTIYISYDDMMWYATIHVWMRSCRAKWL